MKSTPSSLPTPLVSNLDLQMRCISSRHQATMLQGKLEEKPIREGL